MTVIILSYIFLAVLIALFLIQRTYRKQRTLAQAVFRLSLPETSAENLEENIEKSQSFYERLIEKKIPFSLELFVHSAGEEIEMYIIVPRKYSDVLKDELKSFWPEVKIENSENQDLYLDLSPHILSFRLEQERTPLLPIKSPKMGEFSPFIALLKAVSQLKTINEGFALQFCVSKPEQAIVKEMGRAIESLSQGEYEKQKLVVDKDFIITKDTLKILEDKAAYPLFRVCGRVFLTGADEKEIKKIQDSLDRALDQTASGGPAFNEISLKRKLKLKNEIGDYYKRNLGDQPMMLNAKELSMLFHLVNPKHLHIPKLYTHSR